MKQLILIALVCFASVSQAQKFAYVDSDYILERIPEYASAEDQLEKLSVNWQAEIEEIYQQIDVLYKKYQADKILLTQEMKNKRESEIINKEKDAKELQRRRFGPEGDLYNKRTELVKPIQDKVFNAIQDFSNEKRYDIIFDKSSNLIMLFSNPDLDKSDDILKMLGYK
ncbi:OmpH family outer membrane protein [Flavobacteriales bacterium]|mgnify:FL=1|jgi:outer membrane protein|nr:OmpH family outer membrane protein [Flavobacteriales bacterium]MDB2675322.1 OmpH family outer membrane protein [Flavobacteriales bacterium]